MTVRVVLQMVGALGIVVCSSARGRQLCWLVVGVCLGTRSGSDDSSGACRQAGLCDLTLLHAGTVDQASGDERAKRSLALKGACL